ncbi:MAG: hypothetical protein L0Z50_41795 [Verrucomicrobiales bacterium]|nr:hypothetical protein [Verrucomicrobiales bacterium]
MDSGSSWRGGEDKSPFASDLRAWPPRAGDDKDALPAQLAKVPDHQAVFAESASHFIMFDEPAWMWKQMEEFLTGKK